MEATISDFLSLLGDPPFLLGAALLLVLLNYLLWELRHSHPLGERIAGSLWGRHMQAPILPRILAKLRPVVEWVRSRTRDLEAALRTRGFTMRLFPRAEERVSQVPRSSIRQLLCDDPACTICEHAAHEVSQHRDAVGRPGSHGPVDLKLGLPRRKGHQRFPRSVSAPAPASDPFDRSSVRPVSSHGPPGIKKDQSLPFEEPAALDWEERSRPSSRQGGMEALASSSSTYAASRFTWAKSSSGLSELSVGSLTLSRSICQLQVALAEQEDSQGSSWSESKASSEHQMGQWESPIPRKRPYSQTSLPRTAARSPVRASEDRATEITMGNAPFLEDAVIASLESHVLVKRVQHHLGLPVTLLRSLRSFMLPAPDLTFRRRRREFGVATRPQALPFVDSGTRKKLEVHLNRMVRLKRWELPQKIQGALGQMKPPLQPRGKKPPSAVRKQGPGVTGQVKGTRRPPRTTAGLPTKAGVLDSKTTPASQAELQTHLVKKSLEIRLEIFPTIVGHSQKMSSRSKVPRLPKSIPLGQCCPQLRNRLCLVLRNKADTVDMNIKCKYIHFLWGLPTLYMQSLNKMAPRAPAVPTAPACVRATIEFVSTEPPFVEIWDLEYHVLRKRLQHQWGLPGLVLRSVKQFLVPLPPLPARAASVLCSRLEVKILIGDALFLLAHLEIKEKLETHLKTKIIERRWGLPRRALDSLRVFIPVTPPLVKRPKENKKTFALPQGEKPVKGKPATRALRASKKLMVSSGKALQRHLTKKALEVRLGVIAPMAQRSRAAVRRVWKKHTLPKVIPPGLKPPVPRPQELLFMDPSVLGNLQLNIIHKGLVYRWGLLTAYNKSLAQLFQDTGPPAVVALSPSKPTESKFTAMQTLFISRRTREVLEWHVRRKSLQHTWGLPGLIWRSLHYLLPAAPSFCTRKGTHTEVAVSLTEPTFLDNAVRRELERNVQKRILNQQWQLPRRVLQSLRLLHPSWKADAFSQKTSGFPFAQSRGSCSRKAGHLNRPAPSITDATCTECYMREMGAAAAPQRSRGFPMLGSTNMKKVEHHWTKKCVEVRLEVLPAVIKRSQKCTSSMSGQRLPKLVPAGRKPLQPRKCSLPLVSQEDAGRMEVAVRLCHLMSLWGLGTRYVEGLHAMIPSAPIQPLGRRRRATLAFSEGQVLFLDGQAREALELHVRKKRLQHEWGMPILVHHSVKAFAQGSPLAPAFRKTTMHIETLQQDPAFLPRGACSRLEHHLQRLKLQRQWGLPLRVLKSLHSLMPETEPHPMGRTMKPSRRSVSTESSNWLRRRPGGKGAMESEQGRKEAPETVGAALCPTCKGSALKGVAAVKLQRHLAKKSVEVHLEVFPAVPRLSWRHASLSLKQPLPKLIPPGHRVLEPRHASFPFLRTEELDRVEVALRCSHLASLWGLGARYVEAFVGMAPRMPFHPVKSRRAAFGLPAGKPPLFQGLDPTTLEIHIKKKRIQHEWGLPALALRSLEGFMQGAPALPRLSKTVIDTYVVPQVLSFLPRATCSRLEFHVQRMKLQRMWGLPGRILASLKAFVPSASWETSPFTLNYKEERFELAGASPGEAQQPFWAGKKTKSRGFPNCPCISSKQKGMEGHFRKKYLETHLEAFPTLVSQSQTAASGWGKMRLPKLVQAGQKHPTNRAVSLSFLLPATVDLLEVNMKHKHLAFLWKLPSQYLEPLAMFAQSGHSPVRFNREKIRFQETKTPFCQKEARERLEHHIQKKRLHHHWGLPSAIQRSLRAWAPAPSTYAHPRQKISKEVNVLVADIPFVSALAQRELETSLKKMIIHGRWDLPTRLQGYLRAFTPTPLADRELREEEAADGGITAWMPDVKRARLITRHQQVTSRGLVSRQAPLQTSMSPILELFRSSKIRALENHLKKKCLEIKFQLPVVGAGTIKRACLPKCPPVSPVLKPRGLVLFVEPEALLKITLNIKRKYLTYLWGLPSLHTESLKKMFGTIPEWPQKKTLLGKESIRRGRGATRPGKQRGDSAGFRSRSFQSPTVELSFLMDEALDLLESHIRRKKLQHEWGLPSTIQKSLRVFAPFPSEGRRSMPSSEQPAMRPCCVRVSVTPQSLLFLNPAQRRHLEEHLKSRIAVHRWGIPKRVQQSLKMFLPPASLSQRSMDPTQTLLCRCDQIPPAAAKYPQSEAEGLQRRVTSSRISPRRGLGGAQPLLHRAGGQPAELSPEEMHQDKTPRRGRKTPERKSLQMPKFLTGQAWDLLEFHIRRKRIQHEWGLPTIVQKSLRAFAPHPPDSRASMKPRAGAYLAAKGLGVERTTADHTPFSVAEVSVPFQAMMFLDPDVKSHLEAHMRSRTAAHRWGLPKLVQDSLGAFLPPELHSQMHHPQSHQQHETHPDPEGKKSPELLRVKRRTPEKQKRMRHEKPVATTSPGKKGTAFVSPELKPSFLPQEVLGLLAFHIQHKKIHRMWGLPSVALKSLHTFAPFPFETEKNMQSTGTITTERRPWVRGEVQVVIPGLLFLSPNTKLRLEAHLSNMVAKHRWGLPALVQQSLQAFLPPAPSSPSQVAQARPLSAQPHKSLQVAAAGGGRHDDPKWETMPGRRKTGNRENSRQKKQATAFSSPAGKLPFLTSEAQKLLEFHMQRKKVQHLWGLPSTVLKSLRAFAPFPREPAKHAQDAAVTLTKRRPWDTEVHVPVQSLSFLDVNSKEHLEAHVRSRTAEHRWGLPKLVQESLRAFLPPASLPHSGETNRQPLLHPHSKSPQVPVIQPQMVTERSVRKFPGRRETSKELEKEKPAAISLPASAVPPAMSLVAKLPFLADGNQDALEFHIQRKKIQHEWGLPLTVQKSVHAFAPVPPELHQGVPSKGGGGTAAARTKDAVREMGVGTKKPWITGTVNIAVQSLHFLGPDTKENLEAHLRNLTIEHRWGLPKLVHKSMRAFIPLSSQLDIREMEDQECPSAHSHGKILTASDARFPTEATQEDNSEDEHTYHSEPLHVMEQGGGTDSYSATEEPLFCPGTKPEHAMAIPGESGRWKAERESPQSSTLQKRPPLKKATQRQKSMGFDPRQDPRISSLSPSSPGPKKYRYNASSWSTNLPRAKYSSGRIPSGRGLIPHSSKTTLQNRTGMSREVECGFQRMAEGNHPRTGLKEPQAPCISYPGWELGKKDPCACYLRAHRDDSESSLPLDAEQRWGKARGTEPDLLGDPDLQDTGLSSEESPTTGNYQEQEFPSARIMPQSADAAPQGSVPVSKEAESSSAVNPSHALCKDTSAGPRRQAGIVGRERTNSSLPKRGSGLGGKREKQTAQPHLPSLQPSVRALRRWSSKDLCEACRGEKPRRPPKGGEDPTSAAILSPGRFQGQPVQNSQAVTDDDKTDRKAKEGTVPPSKEPRPLSTGVSSQFSTEGEWEQVGDWDTEDEDAGQRNNPKKEKLGSTRSTREMPRTEMSLKAVGSPKRAGPPAARQSRASPKSAVLRQEGRALVKTEKRSVLGPDSQGRRMVVRMQTVRVTGPKGPREEEEGTLHWRKGPSHKGLLPSKGALVRQGSSPPFRMPSGNGRLEREAVMMAQEISRGIREDGQHAQFIQGVFAKDMHRKMSLLGTIVERKLFLRQGFRLWVQSQEREKGSQKSPGVSRPPTFRAMRAAQMRWMELQYCDSQGVAEPQRADRALPARPQQRQADKTGSPASLGYQRRPSRRRKKDMTRPRSRSRERKK